MCTQIDLPKRSRMSIQLKQDIKKDYHENGIRVKDLAKKYGYSASRISVLVGSKRRWLKKFKINEIASKFVQNISKNQTLIMEMEKHLFVWIKEKQKQNEPVSEKAIIRKALEIYDDLKGELSKPYANVIDGFRASEGWFNRFCKQIGIEIQKGTNLVKDRNEKKTVSAPGESEASTSTSDVDPVWQRGLKDAPSESEASTSDVDPTWQRGLQDEVENAVDPSSAEMMDTSNAIYLKEEYKEPTELYCTEYLNNNDIESEFNNSVSNEHIENKIEDNSTLLRTIPTGDNSSLLRTVPIGDNSSLLRTVPTPTQSHLISNSVDTFSEKVPKADNNPEDEFEAFGKYVAMSLRNMPTSNALSVENQIYSAINNEKRLILLQKNKSGLNIGVGVKIEVEEEPI